MEYANIVIGNRSTTCDQPLHIGNKNIGFLIDPLMENCIFFQSSNRRAWCLTFFKGSTFEKTITIFFKDQPNTLQDPKAWWIETDNASDHQAYEDSMSRFLRGSTTKKLAESVYIKKNTRLIVDRENMVLFCKKREHFERIILCQALALAYKHTLTSCMGDLTQCIKANDEAKLIELYENMLRFNAADYFSHPVDQQKSHALYDTWSQLSKHWRLEELRRELTEQLADVANLIREQRNREEQKTRQQWQDALQKKESAFNRKAISISLIITAISLFFQLTPDTFVSFSEAWGSLFID